jgi:hypothetical protein
MHGAGMSSQKINYYIKKLYSKEKTPPQYSKYSIDGIKGHGFNRITLVNTAVTFSRWQESHMQQQQSKKRFFSELEHHDM